MKKIFSVRYKYVAMFLLLTAFLLASLKPIYDAVYQTTRQNSLGEAAYALRRSTETLDGAMRQVVQMTAVSNSFTPFVQLKTLKGSRLPNAYYYKLSKSQQFFSQYMALNPLGAESLILLLNNGSVLTRQRAYDAAEPCFGDYIVYTNRSAAETRDMLAGSPGGLLPAEPVSIGGAVPELCITIHCRKTGETLAAATLIRQRELLNLFEVNKYPDGTVLYIKDVNNALLLSHGYDEAPLTFSGSSMEHRFHGKTFTFLRQSLYGGAYEVVIGIPNRYFSEKMGSVEALIHRYAIIVVFLGVLACFFFLFYVNYRPLQKLVRLPQLRDYAQTSRGDEYGLLREVLVKNDQENRRLSAEAEAMEQALRASFFVRLLEGGVHTAGEQNTLRELFSGFGCPCRVAVVQTENDETNFIGVRVYDQLRQRLGEGAVLALLSRQRLALLLRDAPEQLGFLEEEMARLRAEAEARYAPLPEAGLSAPFTALSDVHEAFHQARRALALPDSGPLRRCQTPARSGEAPSVMALKDAQKLYELIAASETEAIRAHMENLTAAAAQAGRNELRQAFYLLRFVLDSVIRDFDCAAPDCPPPEYQETESAEGLFHQLLFTALSLAGKIQQKRCSNNQALKRSILNYIETRYADPDIYARVVAEACGISEKYLYRVVREHTGRSLADYIENLRIEKAMELIKTSQLSMAQVALACGYRSPNNFYKVFKKYYDLPPGVYRKKAQGLQV